jgi:hypothetical protein
MLIFILWAVFFIILWRFAVWATKKSHEAHQQKLKALQDLEDIRNSVVVEADPINIREEIAKINSELQARKGVHSAVEDLIEETSEKNT